MLLEYSEMKQLPHIPVFYADIKLIYKHKGA